MTFRLIFTYRDKPPLSLVTGQFSSFKEIEQYLFEGHEEGVVIQTSDGGIPVSVLEIEELILQQLTDDGKVGEAEELDFDVSSSLHKVKVITNPGTSDAEAKVVDMDAEALSSQKLQKTSGFSYSEGYVDLNKIDQLTTAMGTPITEETGNVVTGTLADPVEVKVKEDDSSWTVTDRPEWVDTEPEEYKEEDTMGDEEEVPTEEQANKIQQKFVSFREKFLDLEGKNESWEQQIIDKMARREITLKKVATVLDNENKVLEDFTQDKLGV